MSAPVDRAELLRMVATVATRYPGSSCGEIVEAAARLIRAADDFLVNDVRVQRNARRRAAYRRGRAVRG